MSAQPITHTPPTDESETQMQPLTGVLGDLAKAHPGATDIPPLVFDAADVAPPSVTANLQK